MGKILPTFSLFINFFSNFYRCASLIFCFKVSHVSIKGSFPYQCASNQYHVFFPRCRRPNDKMTKKSTNSYYKKVGASGSEKTMIHEKTLQFDAMMSSQRKSKKDVSNTSPRESDREVTHLPNLTGKDGKVLICTDQSIRFLYSTG